MTFDEYIKAKKLTNAKAGVGIDKSREAIRKLRNGDIVPSVQTIKDIHKWSQGHVRCCDWFKD